jgi:hypothetical protein
MIPITLMDGRDDPNYDRGCKAWSTRRPNLLYLMIMTPLGARVGAPEDERAGPLPMCGLYADCTLTVR